MVFSFFKKQPEKMPERPAARPRPLDSRPEVRAPKPLIVDVEPLSTPLPDLEFTTDKLSQPLVVTKNSFSGSAEPAVSSQISPNEDDFGFDDFDCNFIESSVMGIDVDHGGGAVQADIEQVVVMFANGQDSAARALLEMLIHAHPGEDGLRFWALLFDLLQITGDRPAFDKLCAEFTEVCETSPPAWRLALPPAKKSSGGPLVFVLQGVLTAESDQPVVELAKLVSLKRYVQVDCGKLIGCDDEVAGRLAELLSEARRSGLSIKLESVDAFLTRLSERLVAGEQVHAPSWLLLLELLQRHSTQDVFEERAIDYAVTFELSPPSWESLPGKPVKASVLAVPPHDDAYCFSGEIKNSRFEELVEEFEKNHQSVLDFSGVRRLDFFSAGQLVNRLAPYKSAGREIVIRSPNHLVAELMAVVGVNKQARIVVPKS
jgi:anti-anti-sigma regulatory factor